MAMVTSRASAQKLKSETSAEAPARSLVAKLPQTATDRLAMQPLSLKGLSAAERNLIVVTAVIDDTGVEHVLSRFGDDEWDLSPLFKAKNRAPSMRKVRWPNEVSQHLLDDAKTALYCALRQGRNGLEWSVSSAYNVGAHAGITLRYLSSAGVENFSQLKPNLIADFITDLKKSVGAPTAGLRLAILDLVYAFADEVGFPLLEHPFGGKAIYEVVDARLIYAGDDGKVARTPVIPPAVQRAIWEYCDQVIAKAPSRFEARDAGTMSAESAELLEIRDAVLFQVQMVTGMRNSESTGMRIGCWRSEEQVLTDGRRVELNWVTTREVKTRGGQEADFLSPAELFHSLEVLQQFAAPYHRRLDAETAWLERTLGDEQERLAAKIPIAQLVKRLNHIREIRDYLFLGLTREFEDHLSDGSSVEVLNVKSCGDALKRLARSAGVDWKISNHQCRRTFAWNVANSTLGRMGLVFLKWQLKHASVAWTQLYASNPRQSQALYEDFADAMRESKMHLIAAWHKADARLSGGAGRKLMIARATPVRDLKQLLEATADSITLRSTGHAWCLSGTRGCGGQGVYEPAMCGSCSQAVIDEYHTSTWEMIHSENLALAAMVDCGPAATAKAKRAAEASFSVLSDLGMR